MEGLAYKVVPRKGENMINVAGVEDCITKEFKYDGILTKDWKRDHSIYLATFIEHLIQNYSAAFVQLAYAKHEEKDYKSALKYMKVADEISPQLEPPVQLLGYYYLDAGDTTAALQHYLDALKQNPRDPSLQYRLASVYEQMGKYSEALDLIEPIYRNEPDAKDLSAMVFELAARAGQVDRARAYMRDWLKRHPDDEDGKKALEDFERQIAAAQAGQKAATKK
jgi:tetratricopeptide (TPR) repeat protein